MAVTWVCQRPNYHTFSIELPPDAWLERTSASAGITTNAAGTPLNEPTGLSAVKAVEHLGLKLESRRMPVDTIIVDQIQRTLTDIVELLQRVEVNAA
jgi:uncharacterized protein (TIGR03435 family)